MTNTIEDGDLIVELGGSSAGGSSGTLVLNDVSLSLSSSNTMHIGVGNKEPVDHSQGNREYTFDTEGVMSRELYDEVKSIYESGTASSAALLDEDDNINADIGKLVWSEVELSASDGDNPTVSLSAACYDVELK